MSRYPDRDSRDSRFNPRDRTPPRYPDRRVSGAFAQGSTYRNNEYRPNYPDIPRGPRGAGSDSSSAPTGPRSRGSYSRDAPLSDRQTERWRDEGDRWEPRPSPRGRSPRRDRDRDPIDTERARRHSRDGPPSGGSSLSDAPRGSASQSYRGGGYARGRGRGDHEFRGRRGYADDRDNFRPRSRSPRDRRRDRSLEPRDSDPRDRGRDDGDRYYRDRDDRDLYNRRDPPSRLDTRAEARPGAGSAASTPREERPPIHPSADDSKSADVKREHETTRRGSVMSENMPTREARRESDRGERPERGEIQSRTERVRPSSPLPATPVPPQVPPFGGTLRIVGPTSNVWRNPEMKKSPSTTNALPQAKAPPTAPRALAAAAATGAPIPTAPKADRPEKATAPVLPSTALEEKKEKPEVKENVPPTLTKAVPSAPAVSKATIEQPAPIPTPAMNSHQPDVVPKPPTPKPSLAPPTAPSAPRAMALPKPASSPAMRDASPGHTVPTGPRVATLSTSPRIMQGHIPTGPKAEQVPPRGPRNQPSLERVPPQGPRNAVPSVPLASQAPPSAPTAPKARRANTQPPNSRGFSLPAKRDVSGRDKARTPGPDGEAEVPRPVSAGGPVRKVPRFDEGGFQSFVKEEEAKPQEAAKGDVVMQDEVPVSASEPETKEAPVAVPPVNIIANAVSIDDDMYDDDDMDEVFEEKDIAENEAKFLKAKNRLEATKVDLSKPEFIISSVLEAVARLEAVRAIIPKLVFKEPTPPSTDVIAVLAPREVAVPVPRQVADGKAGDVDNELHSTSRIPLGQPKPAQSDIAMTDIPMTDDVQSRELSFDSTPDPAGHQVPTPLSDPDPFANPRYKALEDVVHSYVKMERDEEEELSAEFRRRYTTWRLEMDELDREKEERERKEREEKEGKRRPEPLAKTATPEAQGQGQQVPTEGVGSKRRHQYASEYDMEQVIRQSAIDYEESQKKETEGVAAAASPNLQANIPDMLPRREIHQLKFRDMAHNLRPRDAIDAFRLVPPRDDFTEEEDKILRSEYASHTKEWGKIAEKLKAINPNRTYKDCIDHYYASKWEKPYKKETKTRKSRQRKKAAKNTDNSAASHGAAQQGASGTPQVTGSGRPRRAAAPEFGQKEDDTQAGEASTATGKRSASTANKDTEGATERPTRTRAKTAAKEKAPKKPRNQPLAAKPAQSPQKVDRERKQTPLPPQEAEEWHTPAPGLPHVPSRPGSARDPEQRPGPQHLAPQQMSNLNPNMGSSMNLDSAMEMQKAVPPQQALPSPVPPPSVALPQVERPRSHSNTQRQGASSYWSVMEEQDFRRFLPHFGSDFLSIANHMGSKTQTMIKNHFQKYVNEGKYPELIEAVTQADRRRQLGEDPGPPPTPSQVIKRRNESATSSIQRALAPTPDADAAVDQVIGAQPPQMHGSPSQYPASGRFSVPGQTSRHMQPAGVSPPQHPVHMPPAPAQNPLTPQGHIPRHHQPNGPKLGYFREDRPHHGPSQPKEDVRAQKPPMERIKSEYDSQRQVLDRLPDREVQASKPQMGPDGGPPPLFQGPKETEKAFPPQDRPMFSGHMARQPAREHPEARAEAPPPQQPVHMQQQQQLMHQQVQPPIQPQQPAAQMHPPSAAPPEPQRQQKPPPTGPRHQVRPEPRMERLEQRVEPRMDRMEPRMEQRMEPRMEPRMDRMEQRMEPQEERRELRPEPVHDVRQEMRPERQGPPYGMPFGAPPPSAPIGQRGPTSQMVDMARHGSPQSHVSAFGPPSRIPRHASPVPPTPVQQPAPPQPPPPTKRVNIMSMLNPAEPEEDRPRKRDPEPQPPHGHSTPASMHRKVPGSADLTPTSREFSEIKRPDSRASYPRQAYHSHTPTSSLSTPINEQPPQPQGPQGPREQLAPRDIWQSRAIGPSMQQAQMASHIPPHMGSPHHAPHPGPETRPPMHYRGLSGLDHPAQRAVPSPPPAPYQTHSRVPSYGQQQHPSGPQHAAQHSASYPGPQPHATPHAQPQAPARSTQTPPVRPMDLRPNPYGSIDPPSSSVSLPGRHYAATSHPGAPHARNEFAHTQNAYPLAGHAERKREGQMDRFREREEERRVDRGRGVQEFDPRRVDMERGLAMHEREDARYRAPAGAPTGPREQVRPPPVYAPPPPPQLQQEHVLGSPPGQPHGYEQARRQAETWYPEHARMIDERRQQAPSGQGTAGYDVQHMEDLRMRQMQQQQQQQQQQSQWIRRER